MSFADPPANEQTQVWYAFALPIVALWIWLAISWFSVAWQVMFNWSWIGASYIVVVLWILKLSWKSRSWSRTVALWVMLSWPWIRVFLWVPEFACSWSRIIVALRVKFNWSWMIVFLLVLLSPYYGSKTQQNSYTHCVKQYEQGTFQHFFSVGIGRVHAVAAYESNMTIESYTYTNRVSHPVTPLPDWWSVIWIELPIDYGTH